MAATVATRRLAALTLGMMQMAFGDEQLHKRVQSEATEAAKLAAGGVIRIVNSSGELFVDGWDRHEVEITVTKWIDHEVEPRQVAEMTQRLQDKSVEVKGSSDKEVIISTITARSNHMFARVSIKYHIYAPLDSRIVIDHHGGYILISGLTGDIDVANRRGDILLMLSNLTSYAIDARNKFGTVTSDLTGTMRGKYISGAKFTRDREAPAHHLRLRMGMGGISIKELPQEAEVPSASTVK
jgi:hypothetical protein